jgi:DNA-binding response OmpR family regulator
MSALEGRRIIVLEDNFLVAELIADTISMRGGTPVGPFTTVDSALDYLQEGGRADAALLDVNLDRSSFEIAAWLKVLGIPFVFATGHASDIPSEFRDAILCCKPFTPAALLIAIRSALSSGENEARRRA